MLILNSTCAFLCKQSWERNEKYEKKIEIQAFMFLQQEEQIQEHIFLFRYIFIQPFNLFKLIIITSTCYIIYFPFLMNHRLKWSTEEEQLLRKLGGSQKKNKWTLIAKTINNELPAFRKSAKQCRQKYNNHLMFSENNYDLNWSREQEVQLFKQYAQKGSKWKLLTESFPTKSQNTIKNKFYGNIRKVVRKLNKVGKQKINKSLKPIRQKSIIRIIQPQTYINETRQQIINSMKNLRIKILNLLYKCDTVQLNLQNQSQLNPLDYQYIINIIKEIHLFNSQSRFYTFKKSKSKTFPYTSALKKEQDSQDSSLKNDKQKNESEEQFEQQNKEHKEQVIDGEVDKQKSINNCIYSTQNDFCNENGHEKFNSKKKRQKEQIQAAGQNGLFFNIQKWLYEYCSFHDQELLPLFENNINSKQK